jgi:predicted RNA-binding Zn-ribbon protein involved in translation (DUF1610 family)
MKSRRVVTVSGAELSRMLWEDEGVCRACGETSGPVEPDARGYECPVCGEKALYGAEEALLAGWLRPAGGG